MHAEPLCVFIASGAGDSNAAMWPPTLNNPDNKHPGVGEVFSCDREKSSSGSEWLALDAAMARSKPDALKRTSREE